MHPLTIVLYKAAFSLPDPVNGPGVNDYPDGYGSKAPTLPGNTPWKPATGDYTTMVGSDEPLQPYNDSAVPWANPGLAFPNGVVDPTWNEPEQPGTSLPSNIPDQVEPVPPSVLPVNLGGDMTRPEPPNLVPGLDSSWNTPAPAAGVPPVPGAGADWSEGAPKPEPFGGDLGTPSNPVPAITPEAQFVKNHGGAFDPNSRVDREKMDIIRKQIDPSWGTEPAPIVSNDSLNPPVQAAGVPPVPGAGAPLEMPPATPSVPQQPSIVDQSWDQIPGPEYSQPPAAAPSLPSAPLTDLSWEDVPGTAVTPGAPQIPPTPVEQAMPSAADPMAPPSAGIPANPPAPLVDPSWGGVAGADMAPAPTAPPTSVSQQPTSSTTILASTGGSGTRRHA